MELRHLRYFVALAEQLNFTHAADKVHVTQSTLSHQIRQLEDELGCLLFQRVGKRVLLTEQGETFLESARNALREVENGTKALQAPTDTLSGRLRIGATYTFSMHVIPKCLPAFLQQYPGIMVDIAEMPGERIAQALLHGDLDFGVTYKPENTPELMFEPLYSEDMVLVVGQGHRFARRRFLRLAELHGQPLVLLPPSFATRVMLDECFRMASAQPVVVAQMNAIAPMLELVRAGQVATIVSEYAAQQDGLRVVPLQSPTPMRTPGLIWRRDQPRGVPARQLAAFIRRTVEARL